MRKEKVTWNAFLSIILHRYLRYSKHLHNQHLYLTSITFHQLRGQGNTTSKVQVTSVKLIMSVIQTIKFINFASLFPKHQMSPLNGKQILGVAVRTFIQSN